MSVSWQFLSICFKEAVIAMFTLTCLMERVLQHDNGWWNFQGYSIQNLRHFDFWMREMNHLINFALLTKKWRLIVYRVYSLPPGPPPPSYTNTGGLCRSNLYMNQEPMIANCDLWVRWNKPWRFQKFQNIESLLQPALFLRPNQSWV